MGFAHMVLRRRCFFMGQNKCMETERRKDQAKTDMIGSRGFALRLWIFYALGAQDIREVRSPSTRDRPRAHR